MDFADELSSAAFDFLFNIVKATAVNVTSALKKHTMSVFRHEESSEMRCHENCEAKAQNALQWKGEQSAIALCRNFTNVAFILWQTGMEIRQVKPNEESRSKMPMIVIKETEEKGQV